MPQKKKTHESMIFVVIVHVICLHTSDALNLVKEAKMYKIPRIVNVNL